MDIFSTIRRRDDSPSVELEKKEAFLRLLLLTAASDGHVANEEADLIMMAFHRMKLFRDVSQTQFDGMVDRVQGQLKRDPQTVLTKAKEALPRDLRVTAFATAVDLTFADGSLNEHEKELLLKLQAVLEVPDELAARIIEVMSIKNYG